MDECKHGIDPAWCSICNGLETGPASASAGNYGYFGGQSKQDLLVAICDLLGISRMSIGVGSSLPSEMFDAAASAAAVPGGSMPEIGEAIAKKAGLTWSAECDSRGSISGGGSTVTAEGLTVMLAALKRLL